MPMKPGYPFADTPHPATVAPPDYRYGCHSLQTGDARPRGRLGQYIAHPWADAPTKVVETDWLPLPCGHEGREKDSACIGCANQLRKEGEPDPPPGPGLVEERLAAPAPGKRAKWEWRLAAAAAGNSSPETVDKPPEAG